MASRTVVFVHGMYMTPACWSEWVAYFSSKGYRAVAPAWPGRDRSVEALRQAHPDPQTAALRLQDILDSVSRVIASLDEKPILVGHSMGGLVVQLLSAQGKAAATVAIDSAPPFGVFTTRFSFLKANWGHVTPFASLASPVAMDFPRFQYAFVNGMPLAEQRAAYDAYVVPESRRVPRDSLFARIDFSRPHAPILFIAGANDNIIPAPLNAANASKYSDRDSITDFTEFPGRTHFIIGQPNWREVADYISDWLGRRAG